MSAITCSGKLLFRTVIEAFAQLGISVNETDERSTLVWHDSIKDADYFSSLQPWQVVNRLPMINLICRKAPFIRVIQRIGRFFPNHYNFVPRSFILPHQNIPFTQFLATTKHRYIVKPDGGALGNGIEIIDPGKPYVPWKRLAIAQQYIDSALLDGYKFDLRVYVLVASVKPLRVYVYRNGIARFCSQPASSKTVFSELTNTAVNIKNPNCTASSITKTIVGVFEVLQKQGVDVNKIWKEIDRVVALTMIAVSGFISHGASTKCPGGGYPRCFQLLGFDILLDKSWKPWVLEVNYRPSLEFGTSDEKSMKIEMLKEVIQITGPLESVESVIRGRDKPWTHAAWRGYLDRNHSLIDKIQQKSELAARCSKFAKVLPLDGVDTEGWGRVMEVVSQLPNEVTDSYQLPRLVDYIPPQQQKPAATSLAKTKRPVKIITVKKKKSVRVQ